MSRPRPGKKGPLVFYWNDIDGFQIRTPLPCPHIERIWDTWKTTEKVYNGFENCWDCCSLFGDSPGEPDLNSDSDDDVYPTVNPPIAHNQTTLSTIQQSAPDTSISLCNQ